MTATIIDGRALSAQIRNRLAERVAALAKKGRQVRLDAVICGREGAAGVYAERQGATCRELGIEHVLHELAADASEDDVAACVSRLNGDPAVSAVMVHLPLPPGVDPEVIESLIAVDKDVEGVNPANIGNTVYGRRSHVPCTALAAIEMIESTGVTLPGSTCVCVGASNIVGKPIVILLMRAEATVISTNVYTVDLPALTRSADVLISAVGHPGLITADMVKPGAVVVDVGITRVAGPDGRARSVGDVVFDEVAQVAGFISPVPGGVGPMTVAMLLRNTVEAAERR